MDLKDFFSFSSKLLSSTIRAYPVGLKKDESGVIEQRNLVKGKYKGVDFPVVFKQESGKKLTDILDTGWVSLYLISDQMKSVLEKNSLTGWKAFPIRLCDKQGNEIHGYYGFSIIGGCGQINYEKSEIIEKRLVPTGPICKYYKGLHIGLAQWDGSDFFIPDKTYEIIITQKAAKLLKENNITNIRLENLVETETDIDSVLKKSP